MDIERWMQESMFARYERELWGVKLRMLLLRIAHALTVGLGNTGVMFGGMMPPPRQ